MIVLQLQERIIENKDWATLLFLLCFIVIAIVKSLFEVQFNEFLKLPFSKKYISTYKDCDEDEMIIFEFPHNFINFSDFLFFSKIEDIKVLKIDLKIDDWYFERYTNWIKKIKYAYTILQ